MENLIFSDLDPLDLYTTQAAHNIHARKIF